MLIWVSTVILVVVLLLIVRSEVRCGRKSKTKLAETNAQIDALAKTTFDRYRDVFERDPTGVFPVYDANANPDIKK